MASTKKITFYVTPRDPGLGFSPYQRDKGMGYTPDPKKDGKRKKRRADKRNLKRGVWD